MKQTFLIFIFAVFTVMARGQVQTPLSLISPSGGAQYAMINGTQSTIEWTMGEVIIGTGSSHSLMTIGEQQNRLPVYYPVGVRETVFSKVGVYPNPAREYIKINNLPTGSTMITLADMEGRVLLSTNVDNPSTTLSTGYIASGIYTLILKSQTNALATYKISINNN